MLIKLLEHKADLNAIGKMINLNAWIPDRQNDAKSAMWQYMCPNISNILSGGALGCFMKDSNTC